MVRAISIGSLLQGRYEILGKLGEGGFAEVFRAFDLELKRDVAVKLLKPGQFTSEEDLARFRREVRLLAGLSHPNIVRVYSMDLLEGSSPFLVMEYIQGKPLSALISEKAKIEPEKVQAIFRQVCDGLQLAHDSGIVHRDLSPKNILLLEDGSDTKAKIIDFGLSKKLDDTAATLTGTGCLLGNPPYMSPELARGYACDRRADIYALGCVMYESLTGEPPFTADTSIGILFKHLNEYPREPQISTMNKPLERKLKYIIAKCLQKDPAMRFQSCKELQAYFQNDLPPTAEDSALKLNAQWQEDSELGAINGTGVRVIARSKIARAAFIVLLLVMIFESAGTLFLALSLQRASESANQEYKLVKVAQCIDRVLETGRQAFRAMKIAAKGEESVDSTDLAAKAREDLNDLSAAVKNSGMSSENFLAVLRSGEEVIKLAPEILVPDGMNFKSPTFNKMIAVSHAYFLACKRELGEIRQLISSRAKEQAALDIKSVFHIWLWGNLLVWLVSAVFFQYYLIRRVFCLERDAKQIASGATVAAPAKLSDELDQIRQVLHDLSLKIHGQTAALQAISSLLNKWNPVFSEWSMKCTSQDLETKDDCVPDEKFQAVENILEKVQKDGSAQIVLNDWASPPKVKPSSSRQQSLKVLFMSMLVFFIVLNGAIGSYCFIQLAQIISTTSEYKRSRDLMLGTQEAACLYALIRCEFVYILMHVNPADLRNGTSADWKQHQSHTAELKDKLKTVDEGTVENSRIKKNIHNVQMNAEKVNRLSKYMIENAGSVPQMKMMAIFMKMKTYEDELENQAAAGVAAQRRELALSFDLSNRTRKELAIVLFGSIFSNLALLIACSFACAKLAQRLALLVDKTTEIAAGKNISVSAIKVSELHSLDEILCQTAVLERELRLKLERVSSDLPELLTLLKAVSSREHAKSDQCAQFEAFAVELKQLLGQPSSV